MINVAVLGLGYMGQNHVRVLSSIANVNVAAICDKDPIKIASISKQYKIKPYKSYLKLINSETLNAIFICLPTSLHFQAASIAVKNNIPLFIEKPICSNINEASKLVKLIKIHKTPVMVGHIERFNPVVNEIKQRIKYGELGKIIKIHTQRFSPPPGRNHDVSAITDLATHDVDIIRYLIEDEPIRIYSEAQKNQHDKEDLMISILRYRNGIIGVIEVSWLHPNKTRSITVVGENGMYEANYLTQELFFYKGKEKKVAKPSDIILNQNWADVIKIAFESKEPLQIELKEFINALNNKSKMPITEQDGFAALKMTQKFYESARKHILLK